MNGGRNLLMEQSVLCCECLPPYVKHSESLAAKCCVFLLRCLSLRQLTPSNRASSPEARGSWGINYHKGLTNLMKCKIPCSGEVV